MRKLLIAALMLLSLSLGAQESVEKWGRFEYSCTASVKGNPFDVKFSAVFTNGSEKQEVRGFYDGDGVFKVRFMPQTEGRWTFVTRSSVSALKGKKGSFDCVAPSEGNHGPVRVSPDNVHGFSYADGTVFHPLGTTAYSWMHQSAERQENTLLSLEAARFNKVRMCVFPKYYPLCREIPDLLPYEKSGEGFDLSRPNPEYFRHIEYLLDRMAALGIQADLILFHPYDKGFWGFDQMPQSANLAYLDYFEARVASFRNVWWSLANEYDYCKAKSAGDWTELIARVGEDDPYGHLCSIHGSTARYYPLWQGGLTHASIQDEAPVEDFGRAATVRNIYPVPVIFDEVCYEGNLPSRWGRLSGQEMLHRIWQGLLVGTYVTHGEAYQYEEGDFDDIFWAKGGNWRGESWKRIGFTLDILSGISRPLELADTSRDHQTATDGEGNYYIYFGEKMPASWNFNLPAKCAGYAKAQAGNRYKVEIIDTWGMTVTPVSEVFELGDVDDYRLYDKNHKKIWLPKTPYLLLRITAVK